MPSHRLKFFHPALALLAWLSCAHVELAGQPREALWSEPIYRNRPSSRSLAGAQPARAHLLEERAEYTMWEVMLDVWPDVFAWGYLLVPTDLKPGERRPVVVCQHGSGGRPLVWRLLRRALQGGRF